ncbi:MAG: Npt1/Npt2 family nucleotide transporter [Vicinamibacteria bacterium]
MRPGEAGSALLMLLSLFLLLVGYYVLKTVREPLVLVTGGAELKSYAAAGQAVALMAFVPLYSWLASRLDRLKLIVCLLLFFVACIEVFFVGGRMRVPMLGFVFYIWVGIFSLATIAQFWSYANDIYRKDVGDRLFPLIAIGQTAGAMVGSKVVEELFKARVDPFWMMQIAAVLVLVHLGLYGLVNRRQTGVRSTQAAPPAMAGRSGFALVLESPYLKMIGALLILLNAINTLGEYVLGSFVKNASLGMADPTSFIGEYMANYFLWVNIAALVLQAFVVSRLVKYAGIAGVVLALPVVAIGTYGLAAVGVTLAAMRWAKTAENSVDYSVMNTAKQMLWLPTTREQKYKAKQAIDTFFVRTGDLVAAGVVFLGVQVLSLSTRGVAITNLALIAVSLVIAWRLIAEHRRLSAEAAAAAA